MTVLEFARKNKVSAPAVYAKIKRGILPDLRDATGNRTIPDKTPWPVGRPGVKPSAKKEA